VRVRAQNADDDATRYFRPATRPQRSICRPSAPDACAPCVTPF